jgi:hypothetical protein
MSMELVEGKYRIELVKTTADGWRLQQVLFRHDNLALVWSMYKACVQRYSGRLIMLCEAHVLARSDQPESKSDQTAL